MRALIIDDEPLAQAALANILRARADIEGFDTASDAVEALDKLGKTSYDVLLLDINMNMPEMSGIELLDRLQQNEHSVSSIIFVTAHEEYAIPAFEKQAVDYVLKPFSAERLGEALNRAAERTASQRTIKLFDTFQMLRGAAPPQSRKIAIKAKGRILFIDPGEVVSVHAEGNYVLLKKESGSYLLRESVSDVASKLEPYGFIRIHRSVLVNASFVEEIRPLPTGDYGLRIRSGEEYTVTRTYKKNLRALAEFWLGIDTFLAD
ncbi:MAG: LytTR family DNA-binding domain-containing protein [Candidatus Sulfotelmatobacter sp.]|jgi:two-component system LytT family response regulator